MKNKLLLEELKRFNKIIGYDPKNPMVNEDTESESVNSIISKLKPDLPLNDTSDKIDAIILLQKTLVALGNLNKNYGIDGDGVDGDFGDDTKIALKNTINSTELSDNNVNKFEVVLKKNESKITNVISDYETFIEKFKEMGGVTDDYMHKCLTGEKTTGKGSENYYPELEYVLKVKKCVSKKDMAEAIDYNFPETNIFIKSAILSVMIKEQGVGKMICGPNYNYSGIQTDSGRWKNSEYITAQFCSKDKSGVRAFASFDTLKDGVSFMKGAFDKKNWEIRLLKDIDDENVEVTKEKLNKISKANSEIWQTNWNLSFMKENGEVDQERYNNFKNNGYNPDMSKKSFTDSSGVYQKSVDELSPEELKVHNSNIKNYRSPEKIEKSLNVMDSLYEDSFNMFKEIENNKVEISI